jgi:hypothetical protein
MILLSGDWRPQLRGKLGRALFGGLEELVREAVFELGEIRCDRCERSVSGCVKKNLELGPMDLVPIHLLVMEINAADHGLRREQLLALISEPGVDGQGAVFGQPRADCALGNVSVEAYVENPLGVGDRIADVEG